jgi:Gas vesicle protein K
MILAAPTVMVEHEARDSVRDQSPRPAASPEVALDALARALPDRINADPEHVENGLARLVLTVIELLREILEHQAIRRMDGGTLSEDQIERLGLALLKLKERMDELKSTFGLTDEDLNIDLGPLGRLR